jgi:ribosome-associated protein
MPARPTNPPSTTREAPSKTRRKAEMLALQSLGEQLVGLPRERLARLPVDEALIAAIRELDRLSAHEARRRQMQYIGRLMREVDPGPITEAIAAFNGVSRADTARLHRVERLREKILADEATLAELAADHPGADLQRLRQLRRNALRERERGAPPKNFRALFQLLNALTEPDVAGRQASEPDRNDPDFSETT